MNTIDYDIKIKSVNNGHLNYEESLILIFTDIAHSFSIIAGSCNRIANKEGS